MLVTIDKAGRLVIPKPLREQLSITPETTLEVTIEGGSLRIAPARAPARQMSIVDGLPVFEAAEGASITDLDVQRWRDGDQR